MAEVVLPEDWLDAIVVPLYKKGSKSRSENYRPISLTSVVSKIMEKVIRNEMQTFLELNSLLSPHQHGFRGKRSTTTQLLSCIDEWTLCVDKGGCVDVLYLDFAKAFDSIVHTKLLQKMEAYGINGELLGFCKAFLSSYGGSGLI
jgi:hypothetical protein